MSSTLVAMSLISSGPKKAEQLVSKLTPKPFEVNLKVFSPPDNLFNQSADYFVNWRGANEINVPPGKKSKTSKETGRADQLLFAEQFSFKLLWQISNHTNKCGSLDQIVK